MPDKFNKAASEQSIMKSMDRIFMVTYPMIQSIGEAHGRTTPKLTTEIIARMKAKEKKKFKQTIDELVLAVHDAVPELSPEQEEHFVYDYIDTATEFYAQHVEELAIDPMLDWKDNASDALTVSNYLQGIKFSADTVAYVETPKNALTYGFSKQQAAAAASVMTKANEKFIL